MNKLLFVCTGNYYRSRYAEAYMKHLSGLLKLGVDCESSGFEIEKADYLSELYGEISPFTKDRAEVNQIYKHCSETRRRFSVSSIHNYDKIIIMDEEEHSKYLNNFNLDNNLFVFWSIKDIDKWTPSKTLSSIEEQCQLLASEIWNGKF